MFHNYFFFKRLAQSLNQKLVDYSLSQCFSQNKDELILIFGKGQNEFIIRANLDPVISLIQFTNSFARAGRNSVDLFTLLINKKVELIGCFEFERSFFIEFSGGHSLIFKMHARRANILLAQEDMIIDVFRKNLSQDLDTIPSQLNRTVDLSENNFNHNDSNPIELIPALGKEVKRYLERVGFYDPNDSEKWVKLLDTLKILDRNPIYLHESNHPRISLIEESPNYVEDPIVASNWLYEKSARTLFFEKEKNIVINQLKQRIRKSENYISKNEAKLDELASARNPEEIANILMANLHTIQKGLSKVVLTDIYNDQPITIKLNVKLSPQKNAENYYRKSKNRHQEIESIRKNIQSKKRLIEKVSKEILDLLEINTSKDLRKFRKSIGLDKEKSKSQGVLPYHLFEQDGWQILVGKNSKANDELTLKVANKNDLWLHAKDVAGSHVVIKERPGQNFPNHIIEYAASLAAGNSKRKTDSMAPVIYTPKKFVRKMKGAPAGQVIVEKEEILMIEPFSGDT